MFMNERQPIQLLHFKLSTHKSQQTYWNSFRLLTFVRWHNIAIETTVAGYQKCRIISSVHTWLCAMATC